MGDGNGTTQGLSWLQPAASAIDQAVHASAPASEAEACTKTGEDPCADHTETVVESFNWLQVYSAQQLHQLANDLKKADKPDWTLELMKSLVGISFTAAVGVIADKIGEKAAERLVDPSNKSSTTIVKKVVGESLKKGIEKGVDKASDALGRMKSPDPDEFVAVQEEAVADLYLEAQKQFIHTGRHAIRTTAEAVAVEEAMNAAHLKAIAHAHYEVSRDRYVSMLAQQTAGVSRDGKSTNMATQAQRTDDTREPSLSGIAIGMDRGVMSVKILLHDDVTKKPSAWETVLNGVNETIREQYRGVPLASVKLPRQLVCSVRGDMPDFTVNVDEGGAMFLDDGEAAVWLDARARVANPAAATMSVQQRRQLGLDCLLNDTNVGLIRGGGK